MLKFSKSNSDSGASNSFFGSFFSQGEECLLIYCSLGPCAAYCFGFINYTMQIPTFENRVISGQ